MHMYLCQAVLQRACHALCSLRLPCIADGNCTPQEAEAALGMFCQADLAGEALSEQLTAAARVHSREWPVGRLPRSCLYD